MEKLIIKLLTDYKEADNETKEYIKEIFQSIYGINLEEYLK